MAIAAAAVAFSAFVVAIVMLFAGSSAPGAGYGIAPGEVVLSTPARQAINLRQHGDYAGAISQSKAVLADPLSTIDDKATAVLSMAGAEFYESQDIQDRIKDIPALKQVYLNQSASLRMRIEALNAIVTQYSASGLDQRVFDEIFRDAPFDTFRVPGDNGLSLRKLSEVSYSELPNAVAAIRVARWYSGQKLDNPDLEQATADSYASKAQEFLKKADDAAIKEYQGAARTWSFSYINYRLYRAHVIGNLAAVVGEPYLSQYEGEFEDLIQVAQDTPNITGQGALLSARFPYAIRLESLGKSEAAKEQLDQLALDLRAITEPGTSSFVLFLRNLETSSGSGVYRWSTLTDRLFPLSPSFKAAVDAVIG